MKRVLLILSLVSCVMGCKKGNEFPVVETITSGSKWTLQIGSSFEEVYARLQDLGKEKKFSNVAVVGRQPYTLPEAMGDCFHLYEAFTLQKSSGVTERVVIQFSQNKVSSIETGGGMLDSVSQWPQNASDNETIHLNDPTNTIYNKLIALYQHPAYNNYQIILPDKPLGKPYDPGMSNVNEWAFDFSVNINNAGWVKRSSVRLYFKDGKLVKIRHEYNENQMVN